MRTELVALLAMIFVAAPSMLAQRAVIGGVYCGITDGGPHRGYQQLIECDSDSDCRRAFARHRCSAHGLCDDDFAPAVFPAKTLAYLLIAGAVSGAILGDSRTDDAGNALPSLAVPGALAGGGTGLMLAGLLNAPRTSAPVTIATTTVAGAMLGAGIAGVQKDKTGRDETAKLAGGGAAGGFVIGALLGAASAGASSKLQRLPVRLSFSSRSLGVHVSW